MSWGSVFVGCGTGILICTLRMPYRLYARVFYSMLFYAVLCYSVLLYSNLILLYDKIIHYIIPYAII